MTSVPTPICPCKPFSRKACPGIDTPIDNYPVLCWFLMKTDFAPCCMFKNVFTIDQELCTCETKRNGLYVWIFDSPDQQTTNISKTSLFNWFITILSTGHNALLLPGCRQADCHSFHTRHVKINEFLPLEINSWWTAPQSFFCSCCSFQLEINGWWTARQSFFPSVRFNEGVAHSCWMPWKKVRNLLFWRTIQLEPSPPLPSLPTTKRADLDRSWSVLVLGIDRLVTLHLQFTCYLLQDIPCIKKLQR